MSLTLSTYTRRCERSFSHSDFPPDPCSTSSPPLPAPPSPSMLDFGGTQRHNISLDPIPLLLGVPRRGDQGNRDGGQLATADAGRGWKSGERCYASCTEPSGRIHFTLCPCLCPRLWQKMAYTILLSTCNSPTGYV